MMLGQRREMVSLASHALPPHHPAVPPSPMKAVLASVSAAAVSLTAFGLAFAADAPLPPEIENERILNINKELPHATLMPYANLKQALVARRAESPFARSLNGDSSFHWVPRPEGRPVDFYKPGYDVSGWKTIPVPSCWQMQGYGTPEYTNFTFPFKNDQPHVMGEPPHDWTAYEERNPVGSYRRDFEVDNTVDAARITARLDQGLLTLTQPKPEAAKPRRIEIAGGLN